MLGPRLWRVSTVTGVADDPDDLAEYFSRPPLERILDHLAKAMMDVRDLPEFAYDGSWLERSTRTFPAAAGCRDAFYVAVRCVAEFFVRMPSRDYSARDFLPTWQPRKALAARLDRVWWVASKHVVHMSRDRVPPDMTGWAPEDTSYRGLRAVGRDCWKVLAEFTDAYTAAGGEYTQNFREMRDGTRPMTRREQAY